MKFAIGIIVFAWLACGAIGAWMLGDLNGDHWKLIAFGAVTLAEALDEHPATYPGPS